MLLVGASQIVTCRGPARARRSVRKSLLVTFAPHPLAIVNPPAAPPLLTLAHERREASGDADRDHDEREQEQ